jgi:hypothetical protein
MTDFDLILDSVLNVTLPKWRQMRLDRKRREAQQTQIQERPRDLASMLREVDPLLPSELRSKYHQYKEELIKNLGIIAHLLPSLTKDIKQITDSLFRGISSQFSSGFMESAGEPYQHLQNAFSGALTQLRNIYNLIPKDSKYHPARQNVRMIINYLKSTVGKQVFKTPTGE